MTTITFDPTPKPFPGTLQFLADSEDSVGGVRRWMKFGSTGSLAAAHYLNVIDRLPDLTKTLGELGAALKSARGMLGWAGLMGAVNRIYKAISSFNFQDSLYKQAKRVSDIAGSICAISYTALTLAALSSPHVVMAASASDLIGSAVDLGRESYAAYHAFTGKFVPDSAVDFKGAEGVDADTVARDAQILSVMKVADAALSVGLSVVGIASPHLKVAVNLGAAVLPITINLYKGSRSYNVPDVDKQIA